MPSSGFPPMKIGGPIEAGMGDRVMSRLSNFPPMKIGGPIEALDTVIATDLAMDFPPMKIGGPIEAFRMGAELECQFPLSTDENRWPH